MAGGTGNEMIDKAENAARDAWALYSELGRQQASPGHSTRLSDARRAAEAADRKAQETRQRYGGRK